MHDLASSKSLYFNKLFSIIICSLLIEKRKMFESMWLNDEIGKTVYADESGSKDQYLCMRKVLLST